MQCTICTSAFCPRFNHFFIATTLQSLSLQVPTFHRSDLLVDRFLQRFDCFVHADMPTPCVHCKAQYRQPAQRAAAKVESLALLRKTPDALARACSILELGHERGRQSGDVILVVVEDIVRWRQRDGYVGIRGGLLCRRRCQARGYTASFASRRRGHGFCGAGVIVLCADREQAAYRELVEATAEDVVDCCGRW